MCVIMTYALFGDLVIELRTTGIQDIPVHLMVSKEMSFSKKAFRTPTDPRNAPLSPPNDKINLSKASEIIENTNNPMIYSTIRQFLKFCGYEDNQINRLNFKREILRSALKSKKFLQSKVLTRKEVKIKKRSL